MRFDDSLETVLAADMSNAFGAQSGWRQLVDLIGRGRAPASAEAIARLRAIRPMVPASIRGASARALAFARPPAALVALFADDDLAITAPVLRIAALSDEEWMQMLPAMSPAGRSILRHRRDLAPAVARALESFGPIDFILPAGENAAPIDVAPAAEQQREPLPTPPAPEATGLSIDWSDVIAARPPLDPATPPSAGPVDGAAPIEQPPSAEPVWPDTSFVSLASVARGLPVVVEALRQNESDAPEAPAPDATAPAAPIEGIDPAAAIPQTGDMAGTFQISDLVARIEAFQRRRGADGDAGARPADADRAPPRGDFQFETDAQGVIRWVSGVSRSAVIGRAIAPVQSAAGVQVDGGVAGAFRRRSSFSDGRLQIDGQSDASGAWQISGVPIFDPTSGRFSGYRGWARRPRIDERAEPPQRGRSAATDSLRQLMHELRTPTTAIAGFAEMIEAELLGPVATVYRDYAGTIRSSAMALLGAIDDLDMAARIEAHALELRPTQVALMPLLDRIARDLAPLVALRQAQFAIEAPSDVQLSGDDRAIDRLLSRLLAALVSAAGAGEAITLRAATIDDMAVIEVNRPQALAAYPGDALLSIDAEREAEQGAPLLGTGFALRLARNLATELGGGLTIAGDHLTLRLPAALSHEMGQASTN